MPYFLRVIFCSDLLFQILHTFPVVYHSEENCYSCCNLREELYKHFLSALSREWLKIFIFISHDLIFLIWRIQRSRRIRTM